MLQEKQKRLQIFPKSLLTYAALDSIIYIVRLRDWFDTGI